MISAIILTKDEEVHIEACIASVAWCDEIIVIDDESTDKTVAKAKKAGAKVSVRPLNNNFAAQRNFGISQASGDWLLFIDADERVSSALWYEIMQVINEPFESIKGYYIYRKDTMWGKLLQHGEMGRKKFLRLAKKGSGEWKGLVHETWKIKGKTKTLQNHLDHFPHPSVTEFLREINYYTDVRAQELYEKKVRAHWWSILLYPTGKFIGNYYFKLGFRDGVPGFIVAMLMSLHSFLVRAKLWRLHIKNTN